MTQEILPKVVGQQSNLDLYYLEGGDTTTKLYSERCCIKDMYKELWNTGKESQL
jgi:hypothetical protein